jgi:hypothetical protein
MADTFRATAVNQKNVSLNTNQALSALTAIVQDVDEFQVAISESGKKDETDATV